MAVNAEQQNEIMLWEGECASQESTRGGLEGTAGTWSSTGQGSVPDGASASLSCQD